MKRLILLLLLMVTSASASETADLAKKVSGKNIKETIQKLSSFQNRRWDSPMGVAAAEYIVERVKECARGRNDISVELVSHRNDTMPTWIMPSVVAKMKGTETPEESVIIGGHLDSINHEGKKETIDIAPGADDDASGTATALEAFCVIAKSGHKPKATIEFMAYSAEEIGLDGSRAIARGYKLRRQKVRAVMQLDMVLHQSKDGALYFVTDFTNPVLTKLTMRIARDTLGLKVATTKCGYECSDHASWTTFNYPSVFPFEAAFGEASPNAHSVKDTLENEPRGIEHAVKFGKLGVAFLMEIAE